MCQWRGPSSEWVLSRQLPPGRISGLLGAEVVLRLHRDGIPVSFISAPGGDPAVHLDLRLGSTVRDLLDGIVQQAGGYRYRAVEGRIVLYPKGEVYDAPVQISAIGGVTRARGMGLLLKELKAKCPLFRNLEMPVLRGRGPSLQWGETVELGGMGSPVEHLVSLIRTRPTVAFRLIATAEGRLEFSVDWVRLVKKIDVSVPSVVEVGRAFEAVVTATLADDTTVLLQGPGCGVRYGVSRSGVLGIDRAGRVVALGEGEASVIAQYEDKSAQVRVQVRAEQGWGNGFSP
jgi:hypothetical protein